ncbi:MAG: hypothetical protein H0X30_12725 [Anaerolineae bacterium]|nr:hypothetical protein [Anaerolineae bacterium]
MPGPIVHLIVEQRLQQRLRRTANQLGQPEDLADLLAADPCSPYSGFGSMGPDFLFFSTREYGQAIGDLTNFVFKAYDALEPFIDFYEATVQPIVDAVDSVTTFIDQTFFEGVFTDLQALANAISTTAITAVGSVVTQNVDLFYPFYPKVQRGVPENEWYWFDFLHYRRTGEFCSRMWDIANRENDDDLRRYVLGYASHIGTDVVGHPFVNSIVGGPYRMHWKRHKLVENFIDAHARSRFPDSKDMKSCLNLGGKDTYVADAINGSYYYRRCAFPDDKLPEKLGKMFNEATQDVFGNMVDAAGNDNHPPFFSFNDLDDTYRLWLMWFERATSFGTMHPPTPVPPPGSGVATLVNDYLSGLPAFPGSSAPPSGGFNLLAIFAAILNFVKWLLEAVVYTLGWLVSHMVDIVTLPITEALKLLKWLIYQVHKGIYQIYDNLRWTLVLGGYFFPEPQDLLKVQYSLPLLNTAFVNMTPGSGPIDYCVYPHKQVDHAMIDLDTRKSTEHHLPYPNTPMELPFAEPISHQLFNVNPEVFIDGAFVFDPVIEELYDCIAPYDKQVSDFANTPDDCNEERTGDPQFTHEVDQKTWFTPQLGSAINFSARLIMQRLPKLPNFNLDGDRGFGWHTWRAVNPSRIEIDNPMPVINDYNLP